MDHGNKQIKTLNHTFTSGLYESESKPSFGEDVLYYNGRYYTLSEERIPYMRDKTKDNRFFILTLFAIAYEIEASGKYPDNGTLDIKLNVGLPPSHYIPVFMKSMRIISEVRTDQFPLRSGRNRIPSSSLK